MTIQPNEKFNHWLSLAAFVAGNSEHVIYKMGAIIVKNGNIIADGWNKNKTHPLARNYTRKIHAELDALIGWRNVSSLVKTDMYVVRVTNGGAMATSKPCKDCMILLEEAGLASVTYIDEVGRICRTRL